MHVLLLLASATGCAPLPLRDLRDADPHVEPEQGAADRLSLSTHGFALANATPDQRVDTVDRIWRTIVERYYAPDAIGFDVPTIRARGESEVRAATSDADFYRILKRDVATVGDSHTTILTPRRVEEVRTARATRVGVDFSLVEGRLVVTHVDAGFSAAEAGIRVGMIVEAIDGVALDTAFFDRAALAAADDSVSGPSDPRSSGLAAVLDLMFSGADELAIRRLTLLRADDTRWDAYVSARIGELSDRVSYRLLPSGIGVLRVSVLDDALWKDIANDVEIARAESRAVILDLRGNLGGSVTLFQKLVGAFIDDQRTVVNLLHRRTKWLWPNHLAALPVAETYRAPVAVLIDGWTASAAELVANVLVEQRGALTVGGETCGCVVGVLGKYMLDDGGALRVAELGFRTVRGRNMEGNPLRPDLPVTAGLADLRSGRDVIVDAAEAALLAKIGP